MSSRRLIPHGDTHVISTIRHNDLFNASRANDLAVSVIGCGAIGSRVFESLVQLGLTNLHCYDPDFVEAHNIANQAFNAADIGAAKTEACRRIFSDKTGVGPMTLKALPARFNCAYVEECSALHPGIAFLCVDSFAARRTIYDQRLQSNHNIFRVIDTRMASTHGNVLAFTPGVSAETDAWLATLGSDDPDQSELSACGTAMSVGPTAAIIANIAVWEYMHFMENPAAASKRIDLFLKPFGATAK